MTVFLNTNCCLFSTDHSTVLSLFYTVYLLPVCTDEEAVEESSFQECSKGSCGTEDCVVEDGEML